MLIKKLANFSFKVVSSLIVIIAILLIISDLWAPFTTDATVQKRILNVASHVSGVVQEVYVNNGDHVNKDTVLFSIESQDYTNALNKAMASYRITQQSIEALKAQLHADKANFNIQNAEYKKALHHFKRYEKLFNAKQISDDEFESAKTDVSLYLAKIELAKANIKKTQASLGEDTNNGQYLQAKADLDHAQINVQYTQIKAKQNGRVTNLQLAIGDHVSNSRSSLLLVDNQHAWLTANFNEKGLNALSHASKVLVVYDAYPGEIFEHQVESIDYAVDTGVSSAGSASRPDSSERWVRKNQAFPVRIKIGQESQALISGSKATVMVVSQDNLFWRSFSQLVMHSIALVRYIY